MADEIDPKPAEGGNQQTEEVKKMIADAVAEAIKPLLSQQETTKAEIAGMNRTVSAKDKEIADLKAADDAREKTDKEVMAQLRKDLDTSVLERETEKQTAAQDVKESYWSAEAVKLGLKGDVYVKSSLSKEDGLEYLKARAGFNGESVKADVHKIVGSDKLPGSGNVGDGGVEPNRDNWTQDDYNTEAQKELEAGMAPK